MDGHNAFNLLCYLAVGPNRAQERPESPSKADVGILGRASPPVQWPSHPELVDTRLHGHYFTLDLESPRDEHHDALDEEPSFQLDDCARGRFTRRPSSQSPKATFAWCNTARTRKRRTCSHLPASRRRFLTGTTRVTLQCILHMRAERCNPALESPEAASANR